MHINLLFPRIPAPQTGLSRLPLWFLLRQCMSAELRFLPSVLPPLRLSPPLPPPPVVADSSRSDVPSPPAAIQSPAASHGWRRRL